MKLITLAKNWIDSWLSKRLRKKQKEFEREHYIRRPRRRKREGMILGLTKKNCHEILTRKGFKKHSEPYSYSKWRNKKERVHIKLTPAGFKYHIDNH